MGADGTKIEAFHWLIFLFTALLVVKILCNELTKFSEHFKLCHSFVIGTSDHGVHSLSHDSIETQLPRSLIKITNKV